MKTTRLLSFVAALFISANVMTAQADDCVRELLEGVSMTLGVGADMYVQGATDGIQWNDATGVLSGNFTAVQNQWGGQLRLNTAAPVSLAGVNHITIRMRIEVGGEGTTPAGGYLPMRMHLYNGTTFTGVYVAQPAMRPAGSPHYLVFANLPVPTTAAASQFTQLRFIFGFSHANTTFHVSEISICEVDFTPPVLVCAEDLFDGVQFTATPQRPHMGQEDWATWNDGVISVTTQTATSSPWGLQLEFGFPDITLDHTQAYGLFMDVEVTGGTFTGNFRIYSPGAEFNYPGPGAMERRAFTVAGSPHTVELVRITNPGTFTMVNRLSIFGGAPAGTTITISNIRFCRMDEDGGDVGIPPVESNGMSIHQVGGNLVVINSEVEITSVNMFTVSGQQVAVALNGNQINTSALASGVYLLQVNNTNVFRVIVR